MLELLTDPDPLLLVLPLPPILLLEVMLSFCSSSLTFELRDETCCLSCSRSALLIVLEADGVVTVEDGLVATLEDEGVVTSEDGVVATLEDDGVVTVEDELVLDASGAGVTVDDDESAELVGAAVLAGGVAGATTLSSRSEQAASAVQTASALALRRYLRVAMMCSISS